jgi:hypothetical protein
MTTPAPSPLPVQFPNPAMVEITNNTVTDPVTDTSEDQIKLQPVAGLAAGNDVGGISVGWDENDMIRGVILAGVPQPLAVVQAHVLRGGALADDLDAVVAADNTVATLMLETGLGTFVRYGGDWQLLSDDSGALDDLSLVSVAPGALSVWDAADSAGQTISVFDLPLKGDDGGAINPEPGVDVETAAAIAASGVAIPQIDRVEDLDLAVRFANTHPEARWYVTKRAKALAASGRVPAHWNVAPVPVVPPFPAAGREMEI